MRIVAGRWRGRRLVGPKGASTRPTSDRVREALFSSLVSMLGQDLAGAVALDAFAGSGALGLEALSRGARHATFVEPERSARQALEGNLRSLGAAPDASVVAGDAFSPALHARLPHAPFGLLFLDPPYRIEPARVASLLVSLASAGALEPDAVIVYERAAGEAPALGEAFETVKSRRYGSTDVDIVVYRGGGPPS